jgi:hypothetical protein
VDFSVSSSFKGVASSAGVARRMTVAGTFIVNVPIMIHGFSPAANDVLDTAITLVNTSGQKAVVVFTRVNSTGATLNPVSAPLQKSLQAGENFIVNASELFAVITSSSPFTGWVQIRSNVELKGTFALFDRSLSRLIDVAPLSGGTSTDLVFPSVQIGRSSGTNSVYALINPNDQPAAITLTEYDSRGGMVSTRNVTLPPNGSSAFSLTGPDRAGGSLRAQSSVPVAGAVFFGNANRLSLLNAKPASGLDEFVLAHFGIGSGFDTEITLTNSAASSNPILLAAFDRNNDFFGRLKLTLQPNEQLRGSVSSLFGIAPSQGAISGYLTGRSVFGLVSFGELSFGLDGKVASAAQEFSAPATHLVFPGVANNVVSGNGRKFVAGLALLNPQGNFVRTFPANARIKLSVFDSSGNEVASTEMTIPPGRQVTQLLAANPPDAAFFQRALTLSGAYLVLTSDVPVSGSVVVFTDDLSEMFAVQGQEF